MMNRRYIQFLMIFLVGIGTLKVNAQSYSDIFLSHRVTVRSDDHTVVAYVKPVKGVSILNDRTYYWFSGNQINTTQGGYSGKLLHGEYQDFYSNKKLKESGDFSKGLKDGIWKTWNENGILNELFTFKNGQRNGVYTKYDQTGGVIEKGSYKNDLLSGQQTISVGDSVKVISYKGGKVKQNKSMLPKFILHLLPWKSKDEK